MLSLILFALAAVFNAVMDRTENEGFYNSVFKHFNPRFWYKRVTPGFAPMVFGWRMDAWHIAKSCMVILIAFAIVLYKPFIHFFNCNVLNLLAEVGAFGAVWNGVFVLFYGRIFKKK